MIENPQLFLETFILRMKIQQKNTKYPVPD